MKIIDLKVLLHSRPSPFGAGPGMTLGVVTIVTDDGIEGYSFLGGAQTNTDVVAKALVDLVKPWLLGQDPLDIGIIWKRLWSMERAISTVAIGAIDVALWDIMGKVAGLPIHRLLGTARTEVPAYISSWVHETPQEYADEALHYKSLGYTAYKFHPPTQWRMFRGENVPLEVDIATARAVREAVGPDMQLMSDSPWVYTYEEALRMGRELEELDFLWYEDPLKTDDIYGYTRLKKQLHIPILATEMTGGGPYTYAPWILNQATDYLRGDVAFKGGITALVKIARTAELFGMNFEMHDAFNALNNVAGLNVIMALPNTSYFEILTGQKTGEYGIHNFCYGITEPFPVDSSGNVPAPTEPGLGYEIDWALLRSNVIAEI